MSGHQDQDHLSSGRLLTASAHSRADESPQRSYSSECPLSPTVSARHLAHKQQLGLAGLVCLIFLEVCGGPFGSEESVQYGGPLYAIIGFMVLPLLWSVPEALVTAELSTTFPENAGYVVWVGSAFGPFWGFMEGLLSWISGVTDNTLYPVVFVSYLQIFWTAIGSNWWLEKTILMSASLIMTTLNWRGLDIVGKSAEIIVLLTMLPFILLTVLAIPRINVANWAVATPFKDINWSAYLNVMFWNLNYWDGVSTLAGEVRHPGKVFPKALGIGVLLVVTTYLVPLMVGTGVTTNTEGSWSLGYYGHVAEVVGGKWLALAVLLSAAASQIGQFEAEMSSDSYQVMGMADRGYLPKAFGMRSRYGTPVIGILLSSVGIMTTLFFNFMQIIELLNVVYCMAELLEFAAFIYLRIKRPDLRRAFRVPLGVPGLLLMLLPASALLVTMLVLPVINMNVQVLSYTVGVALLGFFLYPTLQLTRRLRILEFRPSELDHERWSGWQIATSMSLLPMFALTIMLRQLTSLPWTLIAIITVAACCAWVICCGHGVLFLLQKYEKDEDAGSEAPNGEDATLPLIVDLNTPASDPFLEHQQTSTNKLR